MRTLATAVLASVCVWGDGCAGAPGTPVALLRAAGVPVTYTPPRETPLEIVTRGTAVKDPLVVAGTRVSYTDVESALGHAITTATVGWAEDHAGARSGGFELSVELVEAKAEYDEGRLVVTMNTRATLRTRQEHDYLAQTQVPCRQAGLLEADLGAPVIYSCMSRIGRDLASWLGGIQP
jgi:hypothetical protein